MKKIKHSKNRNTGLIFEMLIRKLAAETINDEKTVTLEIIKKYFGKKQELSKELRLYKAASNLKEVCKTEAQALDYIRTLKLEHSKLNKSLLRRQKYNLIKEISDKVSFDKISKMRISNYKSLASAFMIFEYDEVDNPTILMECKNQLIENMTTIPTKSEDVVIEQLKEESTELRLLAYKLLVEKFNTKYNHLDDMQKKLLGKYITHVNDTETIKEYIQEIIPIIKNKLQSQVTNISDKVTQIKIQRLSEMLCDVENVSVVNEGHILNILRYYDLINELNEVHK